MKRPLGLLLTAVVTTLTLVAAAPGSASPLSSTKLSSELLTVHDLPVGAVARPPVDSGVGCLKNLLVPKGSAPAHLAQALFDYKGGLPVLDEQLATYGNAKAAYKKILKTINGCHRVVGLSTSGHQVTGTVTPMKFSRFGNASSTYLLVLTSIGVTLHYDYLIVRKNSVVAGILEADYPSVNAAQFKSLATIAVRKIK